MNEGCRNGIFDPQNIETMECWQLKKPGKETSSTTKAGKVRYNDTTGSNTGSSNGTGSGDVSRTGSVNRLTPTQHPNVYHQSNETTTQYVDSSGRPIFINDFGNNYQNAYEPQQFSSPPAPPR